MELTLNELHNNLKEEVATIKKQLHRCSDRYYRMTLNHKCAYWSEMDDTAKLKAASIFSDIKIIDAVLAALKTINTDN